MLTLPAAFEKREAIQHRLGLRRDKFPHARLLEGGSFEEQHPNAA
jgi:hypothetical protein